MAELKAYKVWTDWSDYSTVVFAKNRGNAKSLALRTDSFEDERFIDLRVRRVKSLDQSYRGKFEMDWDDWCDRVDLVREANFACADDIDDPECNTCPASAWCERYQLTMEG